jgi:hypothetical protein
MTDMAPTGNGGRPPWDRVGDEAPAQAAPSGGGHQTLNQAGSYRPATEPARPAVMPVPIADAPTTVIPSIAPRRTTIHFSDVALPVSIAAWAIGVSLTNATTLGPYGLPAQLPAIFYA